MSRSPTDKKRGNLSQKPQTSAEASRVPAPPKAEGSLALNQWAEAWGVADLLDTVAVGDDAPVPAYFDMGARGATFRELLGRPSSRPNVDRDFVATKAGQTLHQWARTAAHHGAQKSWLAENAREPEEGSTLSRFLAKLRRLISTLKSEAQGAPLHDAQRPFTKVSLDRFAAPTITCTSLDESTVAGVDLMQEHLDVALTLFGWEDGALQLVTAAGTSDAREASATHQLLAAQAWEAFILDPQNEEIVDEIAAELATPAWTYVLSTLDEAMAQHPGAKGGDQRERIAFRLSSDRHGDVVIEPVIQTRKRGGRYSPGKRVDWSHESLPQIAAAADDRVLQAFLRHRPNDPLDTSRSARLEGIFGTLLALQDHPRVFWEGSTTQRLSIRQGHLRLRFEHLDGKSAEAGTSLRTFFQLLDVRLTPTALARALTPGDQVILLERETYQSSGVRELAEDAGDPDGRGPVQEILLSKLTKAASTLVRALAEAPADFPPESHDALLTRLQTLQAELDIEFPAEWTRQTKALPPCTTVRLQLLASDALRIHFVVRPVPGGPAWPPGEGPRLVVDGVDQDRWGLQRSFPEERQAAHDLAHKLGLDTGEAVEEEGAWSWRVAPGEPALDLLVDLERVQKDANKEATQTHSESPWMQVEWADDERMLSISSAGQSDLQLKVTDSEDWFGVEGGAKLKSENKARKRKASKKANKKAGTNSAQSEEQAEEDVVPLAALLAAVREGRRYVKVTAGRFVLLEERLRKALTEAEPFLIENGGSIELGDMTGDALKGMVEGDAQIEASRAFRNLQMRVRDSDAVEPELTAAMQQRLRPYQKDGVRWMIQLSSWGAGCVLADDMGLGKTLQTLAVLSHRRNLGPALVVAPTSVVPNWVEEAARFAPELRIHDLTGPARERTLPELGPGDVLVTSYTIATLDIDNLERIRFATAVFDEAQAFKNAATNRAKALRRLDVSWKLALTGTPIENRLGELWSIFRVVSPGLFGSRERFRSVFAAPIEKFADLQRRRDLARVLRPYVLRRTKAQVAPELPPRTDSTRKIALSEGERALYEQMRKSTLKEWADLKANPDRDGSEVRFILLAALTRLRQLSSHPRLVYADSPLGSSKLAATVALLEELRESGHRALIFSQFRSLLDILSSHIRAAGLSCLQLDGTTPAPLRTRRVKAFQKGEADAFLISLKAGGFGLNLTAATYVIHLDPWWNPAVEDQASDRAHRIGQERPVTVIRMVARDTVEETVLALHARKRELAQAVLEGSETAGTLTPDDLADLISGGRTGSSDAEG